MNKIKQFFIKYLLPLGTKGMIAFIKTQGYVVYKDERDHRRTAEQIAEDSKEK